MISCVTFKIVIAPDSFKESMTAKEVAQAIQQGFQEVWDNYTFDLIPMADGGEGTTEALKSFKRDIIHR